MDGIRHRLSTIVPGLTAPAETATAPGQGVANQQVAAQELANTRLLHRDTQTPYAAQRYIIAETLKSGLLSLIAWAAARQEVFEAARKSEPQLTPNDLGSPFLATGASSAGLGLGLTVANAIKPTLDKFTAYDAIERTAEEAYPDLPLDATDQQQAEHTRKKDEWRAIQKDFKNNMVPLDTIGETSFTMAQPIAMATNAALTSLIPNDAARAHVSVMLPSTIGGLIMGCRVASRKAAAMHDGQHLYKMEAKPAAGGVLEKLGNGLTTGATAVSLVPGHESSIGTRIRNVIAFGAGQAVATLPSMLILHMHNYVVALAQKAEFGDFAEKQNPDNLFGAARAPVDAINVITAMTGIALALQCGKYWACSRSMKARNNIAPAGENQRIASDANSFDPARRAARTAALYGPGENMKAATQAEGRARATSGREELISSKLARGWRDATLASGTAAIVTTDLVADGFSRATKLVGRPIPNPPPAVGGTAAVVPLPEPSQEGQINDNRQDQDTAGVQQV